LPKYIGKGIGRKLLQLGEEFLRAKMAKRYYVSAHRKNRLAVEFYIRSGFTRAPGRDAGGEVYLEKRLR
jgi:ribosomal protein S18 acetylase RimI-like enzyme